MAGEKAFVQGWRYSLSLEQTLRVQESYKGQGKLHSSNAHSTLPHKRTSLCRGPDSFSFSLSSSLLIRQSLPIKTLSVRAMMILNCEYQVKNSGPHTF